MASTPRLYILDDDTRRTAEWREAVAPWTEDWEVRSFRFRKDLTAALKDAEPAILLTWQDLRRSPGMRALELLRKYHPEVLGILLVSPGEHTEFASLADDTLILLPDTLSPEDLRAELAEILVRERWRKDARRERLLGDAGQLPPSPPLFRAVSEALRWNADSLDAAVPLLEQDAALCEEFLEVANASSFAREKPFPDVASAAVEMGPVALRLLVLGLERFIAQLKESADANDARARWTHSLAVADAARRIAEDQSEDRERANEAFAAGLLHDIGKLYLAGDENEPSDHAVAGAMLLSHWQVDASVVEAVAHHHQPRSAPGEGFSIVTAVHAANALVHAQTEGPEQAKVRLDEDYLENIGCKEAFLRWIDLLVVEEAKAGPENASASMPPAKPASADETPRPDSAKVEIAQAVPAARNEPPTENRVERRPHPFGFLRLSTVGWAAACLLIVAALAYMLRPSDEASTQVEPAFAAQTESPAAEPETPQSPAHAQATPAPSSRDQATESASAEPIFATTGAIGEEAALPLSAAGPTPAELAATPPALRLSGIYYKANEPFAVINGRLLKTGAPIQGARITRIHSASVELDWQGETLRLKLE